MPVEQTNFWIAMILLAVGWNVWINRHSLPQEARGITRREAGRKAEGAEASPRAWFARVLQEFPTTAWLPAKIILELSLLAAAALWLGKAYLNLDENTIPYGAEFHWVIQTHHFWNWFKECGLCALWNGSERGGFPALADLQGAILHPIVLLTTWFFGVVNGAKLTVVISFWLAGVGQWWLARALRLGGVARLWSGLMAVTGAHLAGRMELGWLGVIVSVASASLIFAPAISLARDNDRRSAVLLAGALALTIVSGQGYIQIGLLLAGPAFLFLVLDERLQFRPVWREYLIAGLLALLLAAPLILPLAHFLPNFTKEEFQDFRNAQPLEYLVLNFVIRDQRFLLSDHLFKPTSPAHAALYIGWAPVLLALLASKFGQKEDRRSLLFLGSSALLILLAASGILLVPLAAWFPSLAIVRNPLLIAPLSVPPVLALAAYSLDRILKADWFAWLTHPFGNGQPRYLLSLQWLIAIPLIWNLASAAQFSRTYLWTIKVDPHVAQVINALRTPTLQWVGAPEREWIYIEPAVRQGLKLSPGILPWFWEDRQLPEPYLEAVSEGGAPEGGTPVAAAGPANIYRFQENREYAFGEYDQGVTPCQAYGRGGDLTVRCDLPAAGRLVVRENSFTGWRAWRDGKAVPLQAGQWLSASAPAGEHVFRFRYLPWDAPLGLALGLAGLGLSLRRWRQSRRREIRELPVELEAGHALSPEFAFASSGAGGKAAPQPPILGESEGHIQPAVVEGAEGHIQPAMLGELEAAPQPPILGEAEAAPQPPILGESEGHIQPAVVEGAEGHPQPVMLGEAATDPRQLANQDQPPTPGAHIHLSMDLEQGTRVRVTVEVLPSDANQGDSPGAVSHTILAEGERVAIAVPLQPGETPYQLGQGRTFAAGTRPYPGAWRPWSGAWQSLAAAWQAWPHSLAVTLFGLGLLIYLATRLVGLADFPIYFFTDEAVQTNLAADLLANGWRDRFDEFLPTFFKNGRHYNLSLSVYVQAIPYLLFGKSVFVTRAVSVLITLLGALSVSLGLRKVFSLPYWWSGVLVLSITPAWFLHSRTAFETAMATALYAGFIYFYLLYRHQAPRYLYPAIVSAALSFYTYSPAQMVVALSAALLLVSDWRYHRENRRTILGGLALAAALALPYLRFYLVHPDENFRHLNALGSYWTQSLPLSEKLRQFLSLYAYGLNPLYWFVPNQHDLARHLMKGYGHILRPIFPFVILGLGLALRRSFRHPHASAYRTLLIALLAAPSGGALAYIGITRVLFLVIPAAWLATLGLSACLVWLEKRWASRQVLSLGLFALLSLTNIGMARDALNNGPTWYREYGLQGMQYGARKLFAAIQDYWQVSPETRVILSPSWTNGTEEVVRFFLPDAAPLRLGSIEAHMFQRLPLDEDTVFVMLPEEYESARESGKFKDIRVEKTIPYPDGRPGFYFARLDYVDQIDEILAAERESRRQLLKEQLVLDGQRLVVEYPLLDMGEIEQVFDGDVDTLIRSLEANPLILKLSFPVPRSLEGVTVRVGGAATTLTVRVASLDSQDEMVFSDEVGIASEYRDMRIDFGGSIQATRLAIEVKNSQEGEPAHVHVWEISFH